MASSNDIAQQDVPGFDRCAQRGGFIGGQLDVEQPGAPLVADGRITPLRSRRNAISVVWAASSVKAGEAPGTHPQARYRFPDGNLVAIAPRREPIRAGMRGVDRRLVRSEMHQRPELELHAWPVAFNQSVGDVDRVLEVGDQQAFLQHDPAGLEGQIGKPASRRNSATGLGRRAGRPARASTPGSPNGQSA